MATNLNLAQQYRFRIVKSTPKQRVFGQDENSVLSKVLYPILWGAMFCYKLALYLPELAFWLLYQLGISVDEVEKPRFWGLGIDIENQIYSLPNGFQINRFPYKKTHSKMLLPYSEITHIQLIYKGTSSRNAGEPSLLRFEHHNQIEEYPFIIENQKQKLALLKQLQTWYDQKLKVEEFNALNQRLHLLELQPNEYIIEEKYQKLIDEIGQN